MIQYRKVLVVLIIIAFLFKQAIPAYANEGSEDYLQTEYNYNMLNYMQSYNDDLLLKRQNYAYMSFIENFQSDWLSVYFLEMSDVFAKTGSKPDKEKCIEVLLNIIITYDLDNASAISEQHNLDNLKDFKDYAGDLGEIVKETTSIIIGNSTTLSEFESMILTAVDGLMVLSDNMDNWIEATNNLETILCNYEKYDEFLKLIEEEGEGELKEAAHTLRNSMLQAIEIKLNTYSDVSEENYANFEKYFFTDVFFQVIKQSPQYSQDESFKFFADCGADIVGKYDTLSSSWNLGVLIGKLVGNVAVGGENTINRLLETMVLHDISVILQEKIFDLSNEFLEVYGTDQERSIIEDYIAYSQYLIGCRIRGEYCMYTIVGKDAGLLSWFNKKDAEDAKLWYEDKANKILNIQDELTKINSGQKDIIYTLERDLNKTLSTIYQNGLHTFNYENYNMSELMNFVHIIILSEDFCTDETGNYFVVPYAHVNDILNMYFDITAPKMQVENILYVNGNYYFPVLDYGELGKTLLVVNNIEKYNNQYNVEFDIAYVWSERFDTGESNPVDDWDLYYDYNTEDLRTDKFCEVCGNGYAVLEQREDNMIILELYSNTEGIEDVDVGSLTYEEAYQKVEKYWTSLGYNMPENVEYEGITEYGYRFWGYNVVNEHAVTHFRISVDVNTGQLFDFTNNVYI